MACNVTIAFVESDGRKTWTAKRNCRPSVETLADAKNWAVDEARRMSTPQSGVTAIILTAENEKTLWGTVIPGTQEIAWSGFPLDAPPAAAGTPADQGARWRLGSPSPL